MKKEIQKISSESKYFREMNIHSTQNYIAYFLKDALELVDYLKISTYGSKIKIYFSAVGTYQFRVEVHSIFTILRNILTDDRVYVQRALENLNS